jgi:hypothetical protein
MQKMHLYKSILSMLLTCFGFALMAQDSLQLKVATKYDEQGKTKIRIFPANYLQTKAVILSGLKVVVQPVATKVDFVNASPRVYTFDTTAISVWRQNIKDQNLAVLAQLAYGKLENPTDIFAVKAQQDNIFTVSMMSSSLSWSAARIARLGIELDLNADTVYKISISLLHPSKLVKNAVNVFPLNLTTKKCEFNAVNIVNGEHLVIAEWDLNEDFILYDIEKSASKNGTYTKLNDIPFTATDRDTARSQVLPKVSYTDSLKGNYVPNYYRVVAYDYFGDRIIAPVVYEGMGVDKTAPKSIDSLWFSSNSEKHVLVEWKKAVDPDLHQQYIYYGNKPEGPWQLLDKLSAAARSFKHDAASNMLSNYYRIAQFDTAGNNVFSLPVLAVTKDTVPPVAVANLQGMIDKNGVVKLTWAPSVSDDVEGYRVFRTKSDTTEWQALLGKNLADSFFTDTMNIKINQGNIQYSIKAVDRKGNFGEYSSLVRLVVPDLNPPSQPQILQIIPEEDGSLQLNFSYAKLETNAKLQLRRQVKSDTMNWQAIPLQERYNDTAVSRKFIYAYQIRLMDSSGNVSTPSEWISQRPLPKPMNIEEYLDWNVQYDRESKSVTIKWIMKKDCNQCKIYIYRGEEKSFLITNKSVKDGSFIDMGFPAAGYVNYQIQLKGYEDAKSSMSQAKTVFTQ